jgi:hypothetical protein
MYQNDRANVLAAKAAAEAAKDAAPYLHSRQSAIDAVVKLPLHADVGNQGRAVLAAVAEGTITPTQAATLMQVVAAHCRMLETDELQKRVAALENAAAGNKKGGGNA